ncbi:MAG: DNA-binding protein [Candidatus Binatia bacterium]|nr:MAG: DNA-binding protein [Candidatus Binatia bacterium]
MAKPGRREEARRWFLQAQHDLRAAAWNLEGEFCDTACFLAQQASEKALKSLHYFAGTSRRALMTHSVVSLLRKALRLLPELEAHLEGARELDLHYVPSRYPNGLPSGYPHRFYGRPTAEKALGAARSIVSTVEDYYAKHGIRWTEEDTNSD